MGDKKDKQKLNMLFWYQNESKCDVYFYYMKNCGNASFSENMQNGIEAWRSKYTITSFVA